MINSIAFLSRALLTDIPLSSVCDPWNPLPYPAQVHTTIHHPAVISHNSIPYYHIFTPPYLSIPLSIPPISNRLLTRKSAHLAMPCKIKNQARKRD